MRSGANDLHFERLGQAAKFSGLAVTRQYQGLPGTTRCLCLGTP